MQLLYTYSDIASHIFEAANSYLIIGIVLGLLIGGSLIYIIFRRQYKLKFQSEADKLKHQATKEGTSADLQEVKSQQEIRKIIHEELEVVYRQQSVLRGEIVRANEKKHEARLEAAKYKKIVIKLESEITEIKNLLATSYCSVQNCPNRKTEINENTNQNTEQS